MAAPTQIAELVERFASHLETYRSAEYNEAQLREEFLNPFFAALGWDVYNRKGYSDAYKEVIHEAAIKVGGSTKAPDYCFRAGGGKASFFVEAKKPAVGIGEAIGPAFQLRRYAWSAKLPVSILTDFAGMAVYDCRIRPVKTDKAATARVLLFSYREYVDRWDELYGLFLAGGDPPRCAGKVPGQQEGQEGNGRGRRRLPGRDRDLAGRAGPQHRPAQRAAWHSAT